METIEFTGSAGRYRACYGDDVIKGLDALTSEKGYDRTGLVISKNVAALHFERLRQACPKLVENAVLFEMEDGETAKNYTAAGEYFEKMTAAGFTRRSVLVAIGGGVVGDFAGFLAAVYMRGIDLIQVPTTLLSMIDSGLGGKVAVNIGSGKNMVGAFHAPKVVLADYSFLSTLPCSEMVNGLVESYKHALLDGGRLYQLFGNVRGSELYTRGFLDEMIPLSAAYKAKIVNSDEKESGARALLNLGHTVAHALESLAAYQGLSHGAAVAVGLGVMLQISVLKGLLAAEKAAMLDQQLSVLGLYPSGFNLPPADEIIEHTRFDKKNSGGAVRYVLLKDIGDPVFGVPVEDDTVRMALQRFALGRE